MPKVFAIVPAAGQGTRMGDAVPKQYLPIGGKPLMFHCIEALASVQRIACVCVVLSPFDRHWREHDWSTTEIGLVLLPAAVMGAVASRVAARLNATHDPFRVTAVLAAAAAVGLLIGGLGAGAPVTTSLALGLVLGGFAASQGGLVARVPMAVDPGVRNVATGLFQLCSLTRRRDGVRRGRRAQRPARPPRCRRGHRSGPGRGRLARARGGQQDRDRQRTCSVGRMRSSLMATRRGRVTM